METVQKLSLDGLNHKAMRIMGIATRLSNEAEARQDRDTVSRMESAKRFAMEATQLIGQAQHPSCQLTLDRRSAMGSAIFHSPDGGVTGGVTSTSAARLLIEQAEALLPAGSLAS